MRVPRRVLLGGIASLGWAGAQAQPSRGTATQLSRGIAKVPPSPPGRGSPDQTPVLTPGSAMHVGPIRALAISSDGTVTATGSTDRSIRVWRTATGEMLLRLHLPLGEGSVGVVDALAFSPDNRRLYASGLDWDSPADRSRGMGYVFDLTTGLLTGLMAWAPNFGSRLRTLAVSPNGSQIAIAAGNNGLILRDTAPGGFRLRFADPASANLALSAVAWSPDGATLAAADDGRLRLMSVSPVGDIVERARLLLPGGGHPNSLAFSADGARVAVGYADRAVVQVLTLLGASAPVNLQTPAGSSAGNLAAVAWGQDRAGRAWLFAGGTVVDAAGRNLLLAWRDGRPGTALALGACADSITQIAAHPDEGVIFASSDPRWGWAAPAADGATLRLVRALDSERMDFRGIASRGWGISAAGDVVVFQPADAARSLRFNLTELTLDGAVSADAISRPRAVAAAAPPAVFSLPRGTLLRASDTSAAHGRTLHGTDDNLLLADPGGRELARRPVATAVWGVAMAATGQVAVAAHGDGTLRWYSLASDKMLSELGGLFVTADSRLWVAWRNDGRFAHSPGGGARLVGFMQNGRFEPGHVAEGGLTGSWLDTDQLYRTLYDPNAVRGMLKAGPETLSGALFGPSPPTIRIGAICATEDRSAASRGVRVIQALAGDAPASDRSAKPGGACRQAEGGALQPNEVVSLPAGTTAICVQLSLEGNGPAAEVAAFVNEQNVGHTVLPTGTTRSAGAVSLEQFVPLFAGENRIEFRAYAAGDSRFTRAPSILRVRVADPGAARAIAAKPVLRALVVGIDQYQGGIHRLAFARADAESFADAISLHGARDYANTEVTRLFDRDGSVDAITARLADIATLSQPQDAVVIYFSGHGVVGTQDRVYAFVTADVTDVDAAVRGGQGMSAERLARGLAEVRAERVFVFLDTCYAGGFDPRTIGYLNQDTGRYVLAASTRQEEALDGYDGKNGLFAYALKEGLTGRVTAAGSSVDAFDVGRYVTARVEELARQRSWQQRAVFQAAGQITRFPLVSV